MKKYIYILAVSTILLYNSCDDFLNETPETFYTTDNAFTTPGQVDQALIAAYSQIRDLVANPDNSSWIGTLRFNGTDMYDVANIRKGNTFNDYGLMNPSHGNFYNAYSTFYQLSAKMNLAINAANNPDLSWSSEEEKNYALAQAKFFRAYAYRNLGELWGGVPLVLQMYFEPKYDFVRSTRLETYQCAIDDLEAALPDLPEQTEQGGRIVKGAAQHYLCELYLAKGIEEEQNGTSGSDSFDKSILYGDMIINGSIYNLMTERFGTRKDEADKIYLLPQAILGIYCHKRKQDRAKYLCYGRTLREL